MYLNKTSESYGTLSYNQSTKLDGNGMDNDWIDIQIEDPALFTHIALVVDGSKVRGEISRLREKWRNRKPNTINSQLDQDISTLLHSNNISPTLFPVIKQAVVDGYITYHPRVTWVAVPRDMLADIHLINYETIDNGDYEYAIVTPIEATEEEVVKEFRELKRMVKQSIDFVNPKDGSLQELNQPASDTISGIKEHRNWYFRHLNGESYRDIAIAGNKGVEYFKKTQESIKDIKDLSDILAKEYLNHLKYIDGYADNVRKAIKQYERRLTKSR